MEVLFNLIRRRFGSFLEKLNILYDLAVALLATYPKETKTYAYTKTCIWMFISKMLIRNSLIPKAWKQVRCP